MHKTKTWTVRCTPMERLALEMLAQREDRKRSEMLREIVRDAAKRHGLWPPDQVQAQGSGGDATSGA